MNCVNRSGQNEIVMVSNQAIIAPSVNQTTTQQPTSKLLEHFKHFKHFNFKQLNQQ